MIKTKEQILEYNYHRFIGTRYTSEDWPPLENMNPDLKDCIIASMQEYANQFTHPDTAALTNCTKEGPDFVMDII